MPHFQDLGIWLPNFFTTKKQFSSIIFPSNHPIKSNTIYEENLQYLITEWLDFLNKKIPSKILRAEIRGPELHLNISIPETNVLKWHRDELESKIPTKATLVLWSSSYPTHVMNSNSLEIKLQSKKVYAFSNIDFRHKMPLKAVGSKRYFAHALLDC